MAELFEKLPFTEAIDALRERLGIATPDFLRLDAANRSRAFTMARISDLDLLANIHDELTTAITNGETYRDFEIRLDALRARSGWTGTSPWHYRLVYDQNMSMAYSAGRVQQGQRHGLAAWRYLPSLSDTPRPEHEAYYGQVYRMAPGSPTPPLDFGCNCGWEWVLPEELDAEGIDAADLPVFDPPKPASGFVWSPTDYFDVNRAIQAHQLVPAGHQDAVRLVSAAAIDGALKPVQAWFDLAIREAGRLGEEKIDRLARALVTADEILAQADAMIRDAMRRHDTRLVRLKDMDDAELLHQVTFAALLAGMAKEMR